MAKMSLRPFWHSTVDMLSSLNVCLVLIPLLEHVTYYRLLINCHSHSPCSPAAAWHSILCSHVFNFHIYLLLSQLLSIGHTYV